MNVFDGVVYVLSVSKSCTSCGSEGPFGSNKKKSKDGLKSVCKKCCADKQRAYAAANPYIWKQWAETNADHLKTRDAARYASDPEGMKQRVKDWQFLNPDKVKINSIRGNLRRYGLTPEDRDALFVKQDGKCAICPTLLTTGRTGMQVDHDHSTGQVRGLLCHPCNTMLGDFAEDPVQIVAAIAYLLKGVVEIPRGDRPKEAAKQGTRASNLWYKYGLTEETLLILHERQEGRCAICVETLSPGQGTHVDHDHNLGLKAVRGLLCRKCNIGVGHARDDVSVLRSALLYLGKVEK